jgi:hypothetical protein
MLKSQYTLDERRIEEKKELLKRIKDGSLSAQELADLITKKRVAWFEKNKDAVLQKYKELPPEEQAYWIICHEHMKIDPLPVLARVSQTRIRIESYNFCPYLEACKQLGLDTKVVCREIGEPSVQKICEMINPRLRFSRNYQNIRPYSDFCEEYFEVI